MRYGSFLHRQHVQDEASARSIPCACIGVYLTTEQC